MKVSLEVISWALVFILRKSRAICTTARPAVIIELEVYLDIDWFSGKLCPPWLLFHNICVNILGHNGQENQCKRRV